MESNKAIESFNLTNKQKNVIIGLLLSFGGFMIYEHFFNQPAPPPQITIETNNDLGFLNDSVAWHSHEISILKQQHIKDSLKYIKLVQRIDSLDNLIAK